MKEGKYIVIEGGEGAGKSYHCDLLTHHLSEKNIPCYFGREPGGAEAGERMREILKDNNLEISAAGCLFGFEFARAEFFDKIIIPKLKEGINVISDRSGYSTEAYQGYGQGIPLEWIRMLNKIAMNDILPDLTIIIDIDPVQGLEKEVLKDRFSLQNLEFHKRVRQGYLDVAKNNSNCKVIPYIHNGKDEMQNQIRKYVDELF